MSEPFARLVVGGVPLAVRSASGRDALGERFRIRVDAALPGESARARDLLGATFTFTLAPAVGAPLKVHGIVVGLAATLIGGERLVALELAPAAEVLVLGSETRVFLEKSATDVVKEVVAAAGVESTKWTTHGTYDKRVSITQLREDDWSFCIRLLAEAGVYAFFSYDDDATSLVFADDSTRAEELPKPVSCRTRFGALAEEPTLWGVRAAEGVAVDAVAMRDRDPEKPTLVLAAEQKVGAGKHPVYEWPGRFITAGAGKARAAVAFEAMRARRAIVRGQCDAAVIRAGLRFEITDHPSEARNEKLFCFETEFALAAGALTFGWSAIPATTPFRLPWTGGKRAPDGADAAIVCGASGQEIDADASARVVAQPGWDRLGKRDATSSARTRVGQAQLAHPLTVPRIGWEVLALHHDADVDRPWIVGRMEDGAHPPAYPLPDNATRTAAQTLTSPSDGTLSEVRFEDASGKEEIHIAAARQNKVTVGDARAIVVGHDHALEVKGGRKIKVGGDEKVTVGKDQTTGVKGSDTLRVDGGRSVTVNGKEKTSVGAKRSVDVTKTMTTDVDGSVSLTVGGEAKLEAKKDLTREVLKKVSMTVGAGSTTKTDDGLSATIMGDDSETIAGASLLSGKGVLRVVKGDDIATIAGPHVVSAQKGAGEASKEKMTIQIGAACSATAPSIEIEGESEITIVCGGTTLTVKSDGVELKTPLLSCAGAMITISGALVKHNP